MCGRWLPELSVSLTCIRASSLGLPILTLHTSWPLEGGVSGNTQPFPLEWITLAETPTDVFVWSLNFNLWMVNIRSNVQKPPDVISLLEMTHFQLHTCSLPNQALACTQSKPIKLLASICQLFKLSNATQLTPTPISSMAPLFCLWETEAWNSLIASSSRFEAFNYYFEMCCSKLLPQNFTNDTYYTIPNNKTITGLPESETAVDSHMHRRNEWRLPVFCYSYCSSHQHIVAKRILCFDIWRWLKSCIRKTRVWTGNCIPITGLIFRCSILQNLEISK